MIRLIESRSLITSYALCIYLVAFSLSAQENSSDTNSVTETLPEQIIVTGERSFSTKVDRIRQAEVDMYDILNEVIDEKAFEVHCSEEAPLGTRIKMQQTCHPNYYYEATASEGRAMLDELRGDASFRGLSGTALIAQYDSIFAEKMKQAIRDNPELLEAIIKLYEMKEALDDD